MSRTRKLRLFSALVESKLLYSLSCACFRKADLRRLDGFQARCLRKIWGIKPAFVSRVSNVRVLAATGHTKASDLLVQRQLVLFGKALRAPVGSPLRSASFIASTWQPVTGQYVRRVGRPRKEWITTVMSEACQRFGTMPQVIALAAEEAAWKRTVRGN